MNIDSFRYRLRIEQAVPQAHDAAISNTLDEIEYPRDDYSVAVDDYRMNEEEMFEKYWKIVSKIE